MAITPFITLSLLVVGALAGTKQDANNYIDTVLRDHLPANVRSLNLDPTNLPGFNIKVDSTGLSNRDLKAQFPSGKLYGLSNVVRRRGDCGVPGWQGSSVTTGCYVSLDSLRLTFDGSVTGYSLLGGKKDISLDLVVEKTNAFVEATAALGQPATLKTLTVTGFEFRVNVNKKLGLSEKREKKFLKAIKQSASAILQGILYTSFREALSRSVSRVPLPRP
ncbi:salivary anticoagulant protein P23-like [Dermacentor albipictus]|uniref:salivary anticoagulant protein P23-like n=1 Tax=Dermacentor albipictus TaxID=60249 RepID=UPI0031FC0A3E